MHKIISISGRIGSGKDTVADHLVDKYGFTRMSFADSLKDAISIIFSWDRELLAGVTAESRRWREEVDEWWADKLEMPGLTPRWVLQYWGTEVCRKGFHNDIWVASLENKLRTLDKNVVITDCRFLNELQAVKNNNGTTIRVERGQAPDWYKAAEDYNRGPNGNVGWAVGLSNLQRLKIHASEYSSVGLKYDHIIQNDSTIPDLYDKIDSIV